jgi:NADH-quinone oxidoreductase subunit K
MAGPSVAAYLVVSVLLFATGAFGVLIRRSPLIILLALEIMLNSGNLALLAFSRHAGNGDGQIFALTVMVVAAAEAVVGLGLIVAVSRQRVELDVDRLTSLRG